VPLTPEVERCPVMLWFAKKRNIDDGYGEPEQIECGKPLPCPDHPEEGR
jgi:hypothetical protein